MTSIILAIVLAIKLTALVMYILYRIMSKEKIRKISDVLDSLADQIDDQKISEVIKTISWYIKNEKIDNQLDLHEDVKRTLNK